ncbi:hypothetical protein BDY17DRAFT_301362 [Neohortaea acidophila]|uniref:Uncharacterized protein n=1 Tax=Neohortaea acidophila TaxID=245834 RepID=A0A6A6PMW6_9PEZI|nr:uncharacterized protein BDY17DRAFT_301362 [Neohortaea acidophila]KAF2481448.1 hypothetical protein BDY17DRAFT_301362 [Neohortaea acidophila]
MATTTPTALSTSLPTPPNFAFAHAPALELRQPAAAHDDPATLTNTVFSHTGIASFSNPLTYTSAGTPTLTTSTSVAISSATTLSSSLTDVTTVSHSSEQHSSSSASSAGTASATAASTSATTTAGSSNAALAPSIGAGKAVALVCALAGLVACGF